MLQINTFQEQLDYLLKQVASLTQDLSAGKLSPDLIKDLQGTKLYVHLPKNI